VKNRFANASLGQQLALVAGCLCLMVGLALVALGAASSRHMQLQLQDQYGSALAELISRRIGIAMENGDLLSVTASLHRYVAISAADEVVITDVEGKELGRAGAAIGNRRHHYSAPVKIESDIAGKVTVTVSADSAQAAQLQFILSLLGLTVLLSFAAYAGSRHFAQRLGSQLAAMAKRITLEEDKPSLRAGNEVLLLDRRISALPMDLLRTRSEPAPADENYRTTAVLYLHLQSLAKYVDTLDERSLQRYTTRMHQVIYAASGFYAGEIQVARQFGLAVYFSGDNKAGSAAFRACSTAWLIGAAIAEIEKRISLSMKITMAVSQSELGVGNGDDIYPGLYMQHTLDELQEACAQNPAATLLASAACEDLDVSSRLKHTPGQIDGFAEVQEFAGTYRDLLERQLQLIMRRLTDPTLQG
jgi:urease accessory protein UreE